MSDGDNATPGHRGGSVGDNTNQRLTRRPRPPIAAAPWERGGVRQATPHRPDWKGGHHSDGISVAELIAKLAGDAGNGRRGTHYGVDDHEPTHQSAHESATDLIPIVTPAATPALTVPGRAQDEALSRGADNAPTGASSTRAVGRPPRGRALVGHRARADRRGVAVERLEEQPAQRGLGG